MNSMISLLLLTVFDSTRDSSQQYLAYFLLDHFASLPFMSAAQIQEEAHVSASVLRRFYEQLGFFSFKEFRSHFTTTRNVRLSQYVARFENMSVEQMLKTIRFLCPEPVIDADLLMECQRTADMLYEAERIVFSGALFPLALSLDLAEDLVIAGKKIRYWHLDQSHTMMKLSEDDLLLMITITGRFVPLTIKDFASVTESGDILFLSQKEPILPDGVSTSLLRLPAMPDSNQANLMLLEIFNLIKYLYYQKYIFPD